MRLIDKDELLLVLIHEADKLAGNRTLEGIRTGMLNAAALVRKAKTYEKEELCAEATVKEIVPKCKECAWAVRGYGMVFCPFQNCKCNEKGKEDERLVKHDGWIKFKSFGGGEVTLLSNEIAGIIDDFEDGGGCSVVLRSGREQAVAASADEVRKAIGIGGNEV